MQNILLLNNEIAQKIKVNVSNYISTRVTTGSVAMNFFIYLIFKTSAGLNR